MIVRFPDLKWNKAGKRSSSPAKLLKHITKVIGIEKYRLTPRCNGWIRDEGPIRCKCYHYIQWWIQTRGDSRSRSTASLGLITRFILTFEAWAFAEKKEATPTFCLSFSSCRRCNANGRSQNALPFLHHKENPSCYGNNHKKCTSLAVIARYITIIYLPSRLSADFQHRVLLK